jgi:hypothetical protein
LAEAGTETLAAKRAARREERRRALQETRGMFADVYPPRYLEEPRKDWPE